MTTKNILLEVLSERERQDAKWSDHRVLDQRTWITVLVEELGEVARANLEKDPANYREELLQLAAVAVAAIESLDRNGG